VRFNRFLTEQAGGSAPGKLEVDKMTLEQAREFAEKRGLDVDKELPDFDKAFAKAQGIFKIGKTQRKDMPVIDDADVDKFKARLERGVIDINKPLAKDPIVKKHPFPTGLSGLAAKKWLELGLKDGSKTDDIIDVRIVKVPIDKLKPIQRQVYYDKAMGAIAEHGVDASNTFITEKSFFVISDDNYIIDGHHRFLSGILACPKCKVNALRIKLPISKLLPMATAYGDAIGNKRNL
jgi:hypothetical protein